MELLSSANPNFNQKVSTFTTPQLNREEKPKRGSNAYSDVHGAWK